MSKPTRVCQRTSYTENVLWLKYLGECRAWAKSKPFDIDTLELVERHGNVHDARALRFRLAAGPIYSLFDEERLRHASPEVVELTRRLRIACVGAVEAMRGQHVVAKAESTMIRPKARETFHG